MHKSPEPQPLTRLNVTKHDRIWDKELPKSFFDFDNSNTLFSPPLKHITPETTEELWEKFDPLDLLIDSASEKSVKSESSSDTMIMMTTEELKKNQERIKNSFMEYEHRKSLKPQPQMNQNSNFQAHDYAEEQRDFTNDSTNKASEEDFLTDEGYGTDSRTNTTASLSSPLSSSLSSLLTSESSSSQGSMQRNVNGHARPQQIPSNGRLFVGQRQNVVAKKKVQPVEKQDNSLMDRLRALTTIQEEDTVPNGTENNSNQFVGRTDNLKPILHDPRRSHEYSNEQCHSRESSRSSVRDPCAYNVEQANRNDANRYGNDNGRCSNGCDLSETVNFTSRNSDPRYKEAGRFLNNQSEYRKETYLNDDGENLFDEKSRTSQYGIFRAVPVRISGQALTNHLAGHVENNIPVNGTDISRDVRESDSKFWNGDASQPDLRLGANGNSVPSKDAIPPKLSKRSNYMYSMPNLAHDSRSLPQQTDQVVMRRPKPNFQTSRNPDFRYSWDCTSMQEMNSKFGVDSRNLNCNLPPKAEETPKLSNQFRASSEMALQSGRPLFAPSSDIYKLFQGQGRTGFSHGKNPSHRHSFHAMPSQMNFSLPPADSSTEDMRHRLRAASSHRSDPPIRTKNGPVRASHELYNHPKDGHVPNQPGTRKVRPNSIAGGHEKLSTLV